MARVALQQHQKRPTKVFWNGSLVVEGEVGVGRGGNPARSIIFESYLKQRIGRMGAAGGEDSEEMLKALRKRMKITVAESRL